MFPSICPTKLMCFEIRSKILGFGLLLNSTSGKSFRTENELFKAQQQCNSYQKPSDEMTKCSLFVIGALRNNGTNGSSQFITVDFQENFILYLIFFS